MIHVKCHAFYLRFSHFTKTWQKVHIHIITNIFLSENTYIYVYMCHIHVAHEFHHLNTTGCKLIFITSIDSYFINLQSAMKGIWFLNLLCFCFCFILFCFLLKQLINSLVYLNLNNKKNNLKLGSFIVLHDFCLPTET